MIDSAEMERKRAEVRAKGRRLAYDCYLAIYPKTGLRILCAKGHKMGTAHDGGVELATVLTGRTIPGCENCPDYMDDNVPESLFRQVIRETLRKK